MLKRINISVFQPSKIAFFLKDKMGYVFLYMALLAFLASLPVMVKQYVGTPIDVDTKQQITGVFIQKAPDCAILAGQMACGTQTHFDINGVSVRFLEAPTAFDIQIIFESTQIAFYSSDYPIKTVTYRELGIENLDLSLSTETDVTLFKTALDAFSGEFQPIKASYISAAIFITNFLLYISLAAIMAMSFGFRMEKLIYRYRFIMAAYATTGYFILALVAELYGIGIILFFGMILPFITMTIAFNGLLRMSKIVIRKKDDEE